MYHDPRWIFSSIDPPRTPPPIHRTIVRHDDRQACDYCGVPLDTGEEAFTDDAEDGLYCSRRCARKNLENLKDWR